MTDGLTSRIAAWMCLLFSGAFMLDGGWFLCVAIWLGTEPQSWAALAMAAFCMLVAWPVLHIGEQFHKRATDLDLKQVARERVTEEGKAPSQANATIPQISRFDSRAEEGQ